MTGYFTEIDEAITHKKLHSGLNCYIIHKEMYREKRAAISVRYGSVDGAFKTENGVYNSPEGTAHFLEHKLFDNKQGNAFDKFSELGSYVNAYTSFNNTAYYFSCEGSFEENLKTLLGFVAEPHFTDASIKKEMGIIGQEINMYNDNPGWSVYFGMLEGLYENHPAKLNIAGTEQSINNITKDVLYNCYNNFYVPENMDLICCGNIDADKTAKIAESFITKQGSRADTLLPNENENVFKAETTRVMQVSRPIFQIGLKDRFFGGGIKKNCASKIILDLLIGDSSPLREKLINKGLADDSLACDYISGEGYGYWTISGESQDPRKLLEYCLKDVNKYRSCGFSIKDFNRVKKKHMGRFVRGFNSIEAITNGAVELALKGGSLFDFYESCSGLKVEDINAQLTELFREGGYCISVINPEG